jgi:hypothetical protein
MIAMGFGVNILLTRRVFWGAAMWNFRASRCCAASDLECMLMAEFGCGKGNQSDYPLANLFCRERVAVVDWLRRETLLAGISELQCGGRVTAIPTLLLPASFSVEELSQRWKANNEFRMH